jgi:hypothetical protein
MLRRLFDGTLGLSDDVSFLGGGNKKGGYSFLGSSPTGCSVDKFLVVFVFVVCVVIGVFFVILLFR